jgi:RNA polymerase sigma-70 factor (ECF subfamily)
MILETKTISRRIAATDVAVVAAHVATQNRVVAVTTQVRAADSKVKQRTEKFKSDRNLVLNSKVKNSKSHLPNTEAIWQSLRERLIGFVRSRSSCESAADDIVQQVFLRVHQNLSSLRNTERVESWVFQIARNAIADHHRLNSKNAQLESEENSESKENPVDDRGNLNQEVGDWLRELAKRLPDDYRRAIELFELEGVSLKEISKLENISLSGAKSRVQRGRKKLAEQLKRCCELRFDKRGNVLACESENRPSCECDCEC